MIVGARVEQRAVEWRESTDGDPRDVKETKILYAGVVVACERSGAPAAFHALVMLDDGSLKEIHAEHLTIVEIPPGGPSNGAWKPKKAKDKKPEAES